MIRRRAKKIIREREREVCSMFHVAEKPGGDEAEKPGGDRARAEFIRLLLALS